MAAAAFFNSARRALCENFKATPLNSYVTVGVKANVCFDIDCRGHSGHPLFFDYAAAAVFIRIKRSLERFEWLLKRGCYGRGGSIDSLEWTLPEYMSICLSI